MINPRGNMKTTDTLPNQRFINSAIAAALRRAREQGINDDLVLSLARSIVPQYQNALYEGLDIKSLYTSASYLERLPRETPRAIAQVIFGVLEVAELYELQLL